MPRGGRGHRPITGFNRAQSQPSSYVVSGVTKSSTGAVLGYCTVDIFETQTRLFRATTTSDSSGNYKVGVTSPETGLTFFAVAYKTGLPDLAGTSVNTLNAETPVAVPITVGASIQTAINANPPWTRFSLAAGTWNNQVIVPKAGNQFVGDPGGGTILHGNDTTAFLYASDGTVDLGVLMENIQVTHYGNSDAAEYRFGAFHAVKNWTFRNCLLDFNRGWALICYNSTVLNCRVNDNRHGGIQPQSAGLIQGTEIARNNSRGDNTNDDAAGLKAVGSAGTITDLRLLYNYVHDNDGCGLWLDYTGGSNIVRGNTVIGNVKGIMIEVVPWTGAANQTATEVSHNVCNDNTGQGILLSSTKGVAVNNNNIKVPAGTNWGLLFQNSDRGADDPVFENNTALNNTITFGDSSNTSGARDIAPNVHGTGNTIDFTTYRGTSSNNHWQWFSSLTNFAAYRAATGQDTNSTCTTGDGSVPGFLDIGGISDPW